MEQDDPFLVANVETTHGMPHSDGSNTVFPSICTTDRLASEMENPMDSDSNGKSASFRCGTSSGPLLPLDLATGNNHDNYDNYYEYEFMSSIVHTNIHNHQTTDANVDTIGNKMQMDIAYDDDDDDDDVDALSTDSRPTSLREFFQGFWAEFKSLVEELIQYGKAKSWKKKILTVLVMTTSVLVCYDLLFGDYIIDRLEHFIQWMAENSTKAVVAFIALFVVSTLIMIPPTLLVFGAGYAFSQAIGFGWGVLAAILSCSIGSCVGAILAFWRSRYMMRDLIYIFSKRYPLVRAADRALKRKGFHVMLLLRLCPLIPFNGLNYCCGITGVRSEDFAMSLIGILPFQIFTVFVGATAGNFALRDQGDYNASQEVGFVVLIASGVAFGIIALVYTWKLVKKELRKELELTSGQFEQVLHPIEQEVLQQGGIEPSIEVKQVVQISEAVEVSEGDDMVPWLESDEEWFWVWA